MCSSANAAFAPLKPPTRYTLDLNAVPILKSKTHLPVVVDPTHGIGLRDFVPQMALAAVAAGADAIMIEVHDSPDLAKSDGEQALVPEMLRRARAAFARRGRRRRPQAVELRDRLGLRSPSSLEDTSVSTPSRLKFGSIRRTIAGGKFDRATICFRRCRREADRAKIARDRDGARPVAFSHVIEPAQAFLVAAIASEVRKTFWVLCPSVRSQELLYESLLNWLPDALFLPEAEFAAVENILPDPEIAAERLALLTRIEREPGPHVIVATRGGLDQAAPKRGASAFRVLQLERGRARNDGTS